MAVDPRCSPYVLEAVLGTPTARRLAYLANLTEADLATDLSSLIVLAFEVQDMLDKPRSLEPRSGSVRAVSTSSEAASSESA